MRLKLKVCLATFLSNGMVLSEPLDASSSLFSVKTILKFYFIVPPFSQIILAAICINAMLYFLIRLKATSLNPIIII